MNRDQSIALPSRETMTFSQSKRTGEVKRRTQQHAPDFLLIWRPVSGLRDVFAPDLGGANRSRAYGQEAASEAEALQRWLADGGDLDAASLHGLAIIVGDDSLDRFFTEQLGEVEQRS